MNGKQKVHSLHKKAIYHDVLFSLTENIANPSIGLLKLH